MIFICKLFLAIISVLLLLWYIYHKGEGKQIKIKVLIWAFVGGYTLVLPIVDIVSDKLQNLGVYVSDVETTFDILWEKFVEAALLEELLKFCVLSFILKYFYKQKGSGIVVVAAFVGLGYAYMENLCYIVPEDNWLAVGVLRALLSVPIHFCYAVIMGSLCFYAQYCHNAKVVLYSLALILPICLHWLGNAIIIIPELDRFQLVLKFIWCAVLMICSVRIIKGLKNI